MIPGITSGLSVERGEPFWGNVVALLHFEGANGSTSFIDERGNTWTGSGTPAIDTSEKPFGTSSLNDATTTSYITTPSSANFGYGTGDFTIEFFCRPGTLTGTTQVLYDQRTTINQVRPTILTQSGGDLRYFVAGAPHIAAPAGTLVNGVWKHIAVSRVSGTTRMFVNGIQVGAPYVDAHNYEASLIVLGQAGDSLVGAFGFQGHYKELRVTKGVGRYASNFTPPSEAFPDA